jgi:hypothetical protein
MINSRKRLLNLIENSNFIGKRILIRESISINKDNFDRHFTSFSNFEFVIKNTGIRLSGAKIYFMGTDSNYEVHFDLISEFLEIANNEYQLIEILSENVYRESNLKFIF